MRFLADENLERSIVEALRERGHDVASASSVAGAPDPEVLDRAVAEHRILVTNDKDFAELTFLQQRSAAGIILGFAAPKRRVACSKSLIPRRRGCKASSRS